MVKPPFRSAGPGKWEMDLFDTNERKLKFLIAPEGDFIRPTFSQDGREIFFLQKNKVMAFPFSGGIIDWKNGKVFGEAMPYKDPPSVTPFGRNPNWLLLAKNTEETWIVDRATGKSTRLRVRDVRTINHNDTNEIEVHVGGKAAPYRFPIPPEIAGKFKIENSKLKLHSHRAEAAVLYFTRGVNHYYAYFVVWDLDTGKKIGSFPAPTGWAENFLRGTVARCSSTTFRGNTRH